MYLTLKLLRNAGLRKGEGTKRLAIVCSAGVDPVQRRGISQGDHVVHVGRAFRRLVVQLATNPTVCRRLRVRVTDRSRHRVCGDGDRGPRCRYRHGRSHAPGTGCRDVRLRHVFRGIIRAPVDSQCASRRRQKAAEDIGCGRRIRMPRSA